MPNPLSRQNDKTNQREKYEGYSKSNAPNFIIYEQITIVACIIHQKKGTSVRITFLLLHIVSSFLKSYSPSMNKDMYASVVKLSRLISKPIQDTSLHFIVIAISVAPVFLSLDQRGGNLTGPNQENIADVVSQSIQMKR